MAQNQTHRTTQKSLKQHEYQYVFDISYVKDMSKQWNMIETDARLCTHMCIELLMKTVCVRAMMLPFMSTNTLHV